MSRFVEVLNDHVGEFTVQTLPELLADLRQRLETDAVNVEVRFPYFLERAAPATGATALMDYECWFEAGSSDSVDSFLLGVEVPVTSLCPCSKAISDYGAHNQRGRITIEVRLRRSDCGFEFVWIEELIEHAERAGSAPVYPLLKRPDERYVTMQAFDNPVFVEDMVRTVTANLEDETRIQWYRVRAVNYESIHGHDAFAEVASEAF